jgi:hypothetical protein
MKIGSVENEYDMYFYLHYMCTDLPLRQATLIPGVPIIFFEVA